MASSKTGKPMAEGKSALERLKTLAPERREKLLAAATADFAERGFSGASLNAILKASEMSKGQAYYYIHDKADLYCAVIDRALARLSGRLDFARVVEAGDRAGFWNALNAAFEQLGALLIAEHETAALGRTIYEGQETERALEVPLGRLRTGAAILVAHGQRLGAIRTDMPQGLIIDMVFAAARALDRWFAENWDDLAPEEAQRINVQGLAMLQAMVAPDVSRPA
ncbi:TetR/AcrR family transcriptional regulator [Martelella radicis]|uniref:AcrR family transcriptional regulator n=1 Tax=Martelella radicis TaxID=1397476 RepID=A0A7W6PB95_9HYPH|nr:TetR/AcrR family transcriptional regulator [Martelella radicis]MBB4124222.1 AcrR family transcriptional regulator [Martelella radicis]